MQRRLEINFQPAAFDDNFQRVFELLANFGVGVLVGEETVTVRVTIEVGDNFVFGAVFVVEVVHAQESCLIVFVFNVNVFAKRNAEIVFEPNIFVRRAQNYVGDLLAVHVRKSLLNQRGGARHKRRRH